MASLKEELSHIMRLDPAARTRLEVALCYPGFQAVLVHRFVHFLWQKNFKLVARLLSQLVRFLTSIEIHPGAVIGDYCFIDHGYGVVIGETAVIGNRVTLYHDVTLGGTSRSGSKRHPTLEDDVIVGAGAQLLGPIVIGKGARVGANAVVVRDVAEGTSVVGIPAHAVKSTPKEFTAYGTSSSTEDELITLRNRMMWLEQRLAKLEGEQPAPAEWDQRADGDAA